MLLQYANASRTNGGGDDMDATIEHNVACSPDASIGLERLGTTHASTTANGEDVQLNLLVNLAL